MNANTARDGKLRTSVSYLFAFVRFPVMIGSNFGCATFGTVSQVRVRLRVYALTFLSCRFLSY
jgi:hypothetical protein